MTQTNITAVKTQEVVQETPDLNQLAQLFVDTFPQLSFDHQQLALKLFHLLAKGEPVARDQLARAIGKSTDNINQILNQWAEVFYDDSGRIEAFLGLSVKKTRHQLRVDGKTVYTWCAWDTLFIPELLDATVEISSACGATDDLVKLTVSPSGIQSVEPEDVVLSFLIPNLNKMRENITANFCHFVYFFRSREDGEAWVSRHDGTFLLSLEEAFTVGQKMNAARFNETLAKTGSEQ